MMLDKDVKSKINTRLNQGISKSDLFDQFKDAVNEKSLQKFLASKPSYELKLKFKWMHMILSFIWGFFLLVELTGLVDLDIKILITLVFSIYITIRIWKFDGRFFLPGIIWFAFSILNSFREMNSNYQNDPDFDIILVIVIVYSIILILGITIMYYLRKKVFSYYEWFHPEVDRNNEIKFEK